MVFSGVTGCRSSLRHSTIARIPRQHETPLPCSLPASADDKSHAVRLLLVEDEPDLASLLDRRLRKTGYAVDLAPTGQRAIDLAIENDYDVIVLDLMLPDFSGVEILKQWRSEGFNCPTLILTALHEVQDKIRGLDAGADDYLTKPFDFEELLARLRSLLRRRGTEPVRVLDFEDVELDRTGLQAQRDGTALDLTAKELALLEYFMLNPGKVLSRTGIADHVWDDRYKARSNVIDVVVGRLRKKLEAGSRPRLIFTIKGLGYVLQHPKIKD